MLGLQNSACQLLYFMNIGENKTKEFLFHLPQLTKHQGKIPHFMISLDLQFHQVAG